MRTNQPKTDLAKHFAYLVAGIYFSCQHAQKILESRDQGLDDENFAKCIFLIGAIFMSYVGARGTVVSLDHLLTTPLKDGWKQAEAFIRQAYPQNKRWCDIEEGLNQLDRDIGKVIWGDSDLPPSIRDGMIKNEAATKFFLKLSKEGVFIVDDKAIKQLISKFSPDLQEKSTIIAYFLAGIAEKVFNGEELDIESKIRELKEALQEEKQSSPPTSILLQAVRSCFCSRRSRSSDLHTA